MGVTNRVVAMDVHVSYLLSLLSGHALSELTSDMPKDVELVSIDYTTHGRFGIVRLILRSEEFDEVPEAFSIPNWNPTYKMWNPTSTLIDLLRRDHDAA